MNKLIIEVAEDSCGPWKVLESVEFERSMPPNMADILKNIVSKGISTENIMGITPTMTMN